MKIEDIKKLNKNLNSIAESLKRIAASTTLIVLALTAYAIAMILRCIYGGYGDERIKI